MGETISAQPGGGPAAQLPQLREIPNAYRAEQVLAVQHWNDKLFSIRTTRDPGFRFRNGQFVMIGLPGERKPCVRAYSIASTNYEEHLEFFSIKVPDGRLTSRLQHVAVGDSILVARKTVGTLVIDDLKPGRRLLLLATGTGLAPFLPIVQDPETYERFEDIVLVHGVRRVSDLAYREFLTNTLPQNEYLGDMVRKQLHYLPSVTREPFALQERIPALLEAATRDGGVLHGRPLDPAHDRAMICGSMEMLRDTVATLDHHGFAVSAQQGVPGDYVIERAFVS
ncbi:MAG: ferredoxin--NADP reductase [Pseudomonadota bacterium]